jgi:hypothetical protein
MACFAAPIANHCRQPTDLPMRIRVR